MDCLFCKIIKKEIPAEIIYEDDQVIAFNDINPQAPHHLLIIPRKHIPTLNDLTPDDTAVTGHIIQTAKYLAKQLNIAKQGYRFLFNCNRGAGQTVFHIHGHLLGGRPLLWPPG